MEGFLGAIEACCCLSLQLSFSVFVQVELPKTHPPFVSQRLIPSRQSDWFFFLNVKSAGLNWCRAECATSLIDVIGLPFSVSMREAAEKRQDSIYFLSSLVFSNFSPRPFK